MAFPLLKQTFHMLSQPFSCFYMIHPNIKLVSETIVWTFSMLWNIFYRWFWYTIYKRKYVPNFSGISFKKYYSFFFLNYQQSDLSGKKICWLVANADFRVRGHKFESSLPLTHSVSPGRAHPTRASTFLQSPNPSHSGLRVLSSLHVHHVLRTRLSDRLHLLSSDSLAAPATKHSQSEIQNSLRRECRQNSDQSKDIH